jgi:carboxyl-terminal processing protease
MSVNRKVLAPLTVFLLALAAGGWLLQQSEPAAGSYYAQARLFDQVRKIVAQQYVDSIAEARLYQAAADGLVQGLKDPHTALFTPTRRESFEIDVSGQYGGVGLRVGRSAGALTVTSVIPNTPAQRAGMRAGDRIIEIGGMPSRAWSVDTASSHLRGRQGTLIDVVIERRGYPVPVKLTREAVRLSAVNAAYLLGDGVAYVGISKISEGSAREVHDALRALRARGMRSLILDLRGNGGGYLNEAVEISELFLNRGRLVVETRGRKAADNQKYMTDDQAEFGDVPVAVLVDPLTASAAEIIAGALQDHDRAMLVGQRTYGKGVAQLLFPLSGGYALKLTTERWYTPSGRSIQKLVPADTNAIEPPPIAVEIDTTYRTSGGRKLEGGGGIVPDVVLAPRDTLTLVERRFNATMAPYGVKYGESLFEFAVAYRDRHPELTPNTDLPPSILAEFYDAMTAADMKVDRELYDATAATTRKRLEVQLAWVAWGEQEARRTRNVGDHQISFAADLLRRAHDTQQLLRLAATAGVPG